MVNHIKHFIRFIVLQTLPKIPADINPFRSGVCSQRKQTSLSQSLFLHPTPFYGKVWGHSVLSRNFESALKVLKLQLEYVGCGIEYRIVYAAFVTYLDYLDL